MKVLFSFLLFAFSFPPLADGLAVERGALWAKPNPLGLGVVTKALISAGATVVVPARDREKALKALGSMRGAELEALDLMDPETIDGFAERFLASERALHILVNNAGIMAPPLVRDARGYENEEHSRPEMP